MSLLGHCPECGGAPAIAYASPTEDARFPVLLFVECSRCNGEWRRPATPEEVVTLSRQSEPRIEWSSGVASRSHPEA